MQNQLIEDDSDYLAAENKLANSCLTLITEDMIEKDQYRYDHLNKHSDKRVMSQLNQGEHIIFSTEIRKKSYRWPIYQDRILVLTN